jgi:ComF family protein
VVRKRIHEVKFGGKLYWIPPLGELLLESWYSWDPGEVDGLVAVPLHVRRVQQRGFNQAALLAAFLAKRLKLPVRNDVLGRVRWTEPQTRLNREDRLKNVADAFQVRDEATVQNRTLLLIDDVLTTGSTVAACAHALKDAGALRVYVLTVARSLPGWKPAEQMGDRDWVKNIGQSLL